MTNKRKTLLALTILIIASLACQFGGQTIGGGPVTTGTPSGPEKSGSAASALETWKFDYPDAGTISADGVTIDGFPQTVDAKTVLVATGKFKNTIGKGSQSWLGEPGTTLVGPEFSQAKIDSSGGAIERISPINQKLIDEPGENFHLNEDRIDVCSFGSADLQVNGVHMTFAYEPGHNYLFIGRGLFGDQLQDTDRNHTIQFDQIVGSHAQCMSYPQNGGGFMSEGNFKQVAALSHKDAGDCGDAGCSKLTVVFFDLNSGAVTIISQANLNKPWVFVKSNWFQQ